MIGSVPNVGGKVGLEPSGEGRCPRSARCAAPLLGALLLASCGALVGDQATVGGETHFLVTCEQGCGPGLSCIEGVCTRGCEPGYSSCSELATEAACVSAPEGGADTSGFRGTCDVACTENADCASLGAQHGCSAGRCRALPSPELAAGSARQALVDAVSADTCTSGLRWVGGDTPSAEMHPGSDCVGCHRETGAPALLLAGTVYPTSANGYMSAPLIDGCFGMEGIEVTIEDALGRERSTLTNRAGNFYFEGAESELAMPYSAGIRWRLDGEEIWTRMAISPSYGGCGHCHGTSEPASGEFTLFPDPGYVVPTWGIIPPGLYPFPN